MAAALPSSADGVVTPSACLSCLEIREERLPELVGSFLQSPFLLHIIPMVAAPTTPAPDTESPPPLCSDSGPAASLRRSRAQPALSLTGAESSPRRRHGSLLWDFLRVMDAAPPPGTKFLMLFLNSSTAPMTLASAQTGSSTSSESYVLGPPVKNKTRTFNPVGDAGAAAGGDGPPSPHHTHRCTSLWLQLGSCRCVRACVREIITGY